jgi:hypothetical protein
MYLSLNEDFSIARLPQAQNYGVETLLEKGSSRVNEDRLLVAGNIYGVFDGATSLGEDISPGESTGGALAAEIAEKTFRHSQGSLLAAAVEANSRIAKAQICAGVDYSRRHTLWTTSAAVVQIKGNSIEYCQTGDALIMLLYQDEHYRLLTPEIDIDRETLLLWKKLSSSAKDSKESIYKALDEQIRTVRLEMNRTYGVLNGEKEAVHFINYGLESLKGVTDILLFTDGLYLPKEDPAALSDWDLFVDLYRDNGLQGVRDSVRYMQGSDPGLSLYPRFKMHDDIAAVAIPFTSQES